MCAQFQAPYLQMLTAAPISQKKISVSRCISFFLFWKCSDRLVTGFPAWIHLRFLLLLEHQFKRRPAAQLRGKYKSGGQTRISIGQSKQDLKIDSASEPSGLKGHCCPESPCWPMLLCFFTCPRTCLQTYPFLSKALKRGHFLTPGCIQYTNSSLPQPCSRGRE